MKKQATILIVLVLLVLIAFVVASENSGVLLNKKEVQQILYICKQNCTIDRKITSQNCISSSTSQSEQVRNSYKQCLSNLKDNFKLDKINKTAFNQGIKNCTENYLKGLKAIDETRKECVKNATGINCEKKCMNDYCLELYEPVCGHDNKTYQNECQLKNADVKKACNGECPCKIVCSEYYWFDLNHTKECKKKKFCGTFMYQGLRIFDKKEDCITALENMTGEEYGSKKCAKNEDCEENEFCKKEFCSDEKGKCKKIQQTCSNNYKPVCGCDRKTYSNDCVASHNKVNKKADGICIQCQADADCPQIVCFKAPCPQFKCVQGNCNFFSINEIEIKKQCNSGAGNSCSLD